MSSRTSQLAVVDVFEELLLGPGRPQELPLLMAAWTKAQLAAEGHQELVPAVGAADSCRTLVENPAVEISMDGGFHTAAQIAVGGLEALLLDQKEALEVVGQGAVENGALGSPGAVGASLGRGATPLHSTEERGNRRP